jgi:hypothetical protein
MFAQSLFIEPSKLQTLLTVTGAMFLFLGLVYFAITKVDFILRLFRIDKLFDDEVLVTLPKGSLIIAYSCIIIGLYNVVVNGPFLLVYLFGAIRRSNTNTPDYMDSGYFTLYESMYSLVPFIAGIVLIIFAKYIGVKVHKRWIEDVKVED